MPNPAILWDAVEGNFAKCETKEEHDKYWLRVDGFCHDREDVERLDAIAKKYEDNHATA